MGVPCCNIQRFSIKGPRGSQSSISHFRLPIGNGMSAHDVVTWARWTVKLFVSELAVYQVSVVTLSVSPRSETLIGHWWDQWHFCDEIFPAHFCGMSSINKNEITAELWLVHCGLAGKILQNLVHQRQKDKRGPWWGKVWGPFLSHPSPFPAEHAQFQGDKQASLEPEWNMPVVWENPKRPCKLTASGSTEREGGGDN